MLLNFKKIVATNGCKNRIRKIYIHLFSYVERHKNHFANQFNFLVLSAYKQLAQLVVLAELYE